jgi:2-oxoacid:acceptor oxidoreductase gamma subunit (pyruvate/2-ketoisovalerate family)
VASNILAAAAFFEDKWVQSFPFFGVERRGAPVTAYTKIDDKPIWDRSEIREPDYVIVLDSSLVAVVDITHGLKQEGLILVNSEKKPSEIELGDSFRISTVDATTIAVAHGLGSKSAPIVNSAILGAFCRASGEVAIESLEKSIMKMAPAKPKENAAAALEAYEKVSS